MQSAGWGGVRFHEKQQQRGTVKSDGRKHGMLDKIPHNHLIIGLSICLSVCPLTYSENNMGNLSQDIEDKVAYKDIYLIARQAKLQPSEEMKREKATLPCPS